MNEKSSPNQSGAPKTAVEQISEFSGSDLHDLCDAADAAIVDGGGFGWLTPPPREVMEAYWKGVLLIPERQVFVGRLDGMIAGSAQLLHPPKNNEAGAACGNLTTFFVAPWARGHGLAPQLVSLAEAAARRAGFEVLNLDVRETQERAIQVYEQMNFVRWGTHPYYAYAGGRWLKGHYYYKDLTAQT